MATKTSKSSVSTTKKDNVLLEVKDLTTHFFYSRWSSESSRWNFLQCT